MRVTTTSWRPRRGSVVSLPLRSDNASGKLVALGRLLTVDGGEPILLSWSGSMFEYLMPLILMPTYEHTLLDQTCKAAVARQIDYGKMRGVPWVFRNRATT